MKKIIYAVVFAFCSALVFTSCTEEEVTPVTNNTGSVNFADEVKK